MVNKDIIQIAFNGYIRSPFPEGGQSANLREVKSIKRQIIQTVFFPLDFASRIYNITFNAILVIG